MDVLVNSIKLRQIVDSAIDYGRNRAREANCEIKPVITLQEAYNMSSRDMVTKAIKYGELNVLKKGGRTSKRWIVRADFDAWLLDNKITK